MPLLFLWLTLLLPAAWADLPLEDASQPPPSLPTAVEVGLRLVALTHLDPPKEPFPNFRAEVLLEARWRDPRLSFDPDRTGGEPERYQGTKAQRASDTMWWPDLGVENEDGPRLIEHQELDIYPDGRVRYVERFAVRAHADVDLRRFPFDHQQLSLRIASQVWPATHLTLSVAASEVSHDPTHKNLEWLIHELSAEVSTEDRLRAHAPVDVLRTTLHIERQPGFYLYKLLLPLVLIVIFTWTAFWLKDEPSPGRMQRTFVALLTVVAFHHIVAGHLARVPYLTFVDAVVYAAFLSVGATLAQIIRIHNAQHAGDVDRAHRLEAMGRYAHPVGFFITLIVLWVWFHR